MNHFFVGNWGGFNIFFSYSWDKHIHKRCQVVLSNKTQTLQMIELMIGRSQSSMVLESRSRAGQPTLPQSPRSRPDLAALVRLSIETEEVSSNNSTRRPLAAELTKEKTRYAKPEVDSVFLKASHRILCTQAGFSSTFSVNQCSAPMTTLARRQSCSWRQAPQ